MASAFRSSTSRILTASKRPSAISSIIVPQSRIAAFHVSQRRDLLPAGPQVLNGTVNDAAPVPESNATHGSYHWAFERLIAVSMIPLTIAPFAAGTAYPAIDAALGTALLLHSHIGFDASVTDYFPKRHPRLRKTMFWVLRISTVTVGIGLFSFQTNDVGITEAIARLWHA